MRARARPLNRSAVLAGALACAQVLWSACACAATPRRPVPPMALSTRVAPGPDGPLWSLGRADARLIQAGWLLDPKTGRWNAQVELRLVNRDIRRPFHHSVLVEFLDARGRASVWRTFVSLAPGTAQHRRIQAPGRLACAGPPGSCPSLKVRVELRRGAPGVRVWSIPRLALDDPDAPAQGVPFYVRSVEPGPAPVLRLMDGRRVLPLGLRCPPDLRTAAANWTRTQVMDAPVVLTYDGLPPDKAGRWLAYVTLPDGRDLGAELLRRGLAAPDSRSRFSREKAYRGLASAAARPKAASSAP